MSGTYELPHALDVKTTAGKKTDALIESLPASAAAKKLLNRVLGAARKCDVLFANNAVDVEAMLKDPTKISGHMKGIADEEGNFEELQSGAKALLDFVKKIPVSPANKKVIEALKDALAEVDATCVRSLKNLDDARDPLMRLQLKNEQLSKVGLQEILSVAPLREAYMKHCAKEFSIENFTYLSKRKGKKVPSTLNEAKGLNLDALNLSWKTKSALYDSMETIHTEFGVTESAELRSAFDLLSEADIGMKPSELWADWEDKWNKAYNELYSLSSDTIVRFKQNDDVLAMLANLQK